MSQQISRHQLYAMGMPFGDGATRMKPGGRGRIYGFGGGGGGSVRYDNLEKLYEIQAKQAESLMDQANKNVYPNYNLLVEQARDTGSIANQEIAAQRAASDASAASGGAKKNLEENLASMGVNPSDPRYANTMASMELQGAAGKAAAETGARDKARDLGFARLTDVTNAGMGIGSNAVASLNSAGGMASNIANMQNQQSMMNAQGMGNIAALGTRLLTMKCGGLVRPVKKYAGGGFTGGGITGSMAAIQPPPPPTAVGTTSKGAAVANGVTSTALASGTRGVGTAIEKVGNVVGEFAPEAGNSISSFGTGMRLGEQAKPAIDAYNAAATGTETAGAAAAGAEAAGAAATGAEAAGAAGAAEGAAAAAGAAEAATAAGTTASAMGAGSALASTLGAAMPWVGGAMLIGSALGLFRDGGNVDGVKDARVIDAVDGRKGGYADGPGGPKDDAIPAMLSNGEFVMPAGTVQLYGIEQLEKMRARGLRHEKKMGIA